MRGGPMKRGNEKLSEGLVNLLETLGIEEEPMGVHYTDVEPAQGISPKPQNPASREAEEKGELDWNAILENFSCVLGHVWRARKKRIAAYFDKERFGCLGGAFYLGFMRPYLNMHPFFISTGIPNVFEGERYAASPEVARAFFDAIDPIPATKRYCVIKPIDQFYVDEFPEVVLFFARPEVISGLFFLVSFVTEDIEAVKVPFGPGCSGLVTWPLKYIEHGKECAVLGSLDPSCRRFLKTDELSFAVPLSIYNKMLERWEQTFLSKETWKTVQKKIARSRKAWRED